MAQLRQDYDKFSAQDTEIVVVGPEDQKAFSNYWQKHDLPFIGLPDPTHTVLKQFGQEVNLFKLGRVPALLVIDKKGQVRYQHYSASMSDIPENELVLGILDKLNQEVR